MSPPSDPAKSPTSRLERINYRLKHSPVIEFIEYAGKLTVVVAVISGAWSGIKWQLEADNRDKERHYRAWELINSARGSTGDGGRRDALQDLNKDRVSLAAAPLEQAWLRDIDLRGAHLEKANLQGADLEGADLSSADLEGADLEGAHLEKAKLFGADLEGADLFGADLSSADLRHAGLQDADLEKATLFHADLQVHADLQDADLRRAGFVEAHLGRAQFGGANLGGANLGGANLEGALLGGSNLQSAKDLTQEQLDAANGDNDTLLPDGLTRPAHWSKSEASESRPPATK